jgi:hypothetical protein
LGSVRAKAATASTSTVAAILIPQWQTYTPTRALIV